MKKIAVVGPECTGKSWLSQNLAGHFNTSWVPEYAREYIDKLGRPYNMDDLLKIAKGQMELEDRIALESTGFIFCDTNLYIIKIWSESKYGRCDPWILNEIKNRKYELHLLTSVEIPWEDDPQREHPGMRNYFYDLYQKELIHDKVKFFEVKGLLDARLQSAISSVSSIL